MKNIFKILFAILAVAILAVVAFVFPKVLSPSALSLWLDPSASACIDGACFEVEVAKTEFERQKGLMDRESLDKENGMLFVFEEEGAYPFWMKDTLIPLDIIWIDSEGKIVFIAQNVQPCQEGLECKPVDPLLSAKYVLEINGGLAREFAIEPGDSVNISFRGIID